LAGLWLASPSLQAGVGRRPVAGPFIRACAAVAAAASAVHPDQPATMSQWGLGPVCADPSDPSPPAANCSCNWSPQAGAQLANISLRPVVLERPEGAAAAALTVTRAPGAAGPSPRSLAVSSSARTLELHVQRHSDACFSYVGTVRGVPVEGGAGLHAATIDLTVRCRVPGAGQQAAAAQACKHACG
jgi:hypothetical protein